MSDHRESRSAKAAWQAQSVTLPQLSVNYLRNRVRDHRFRERARSTFDVVLGIVAAIAAVWLTVNVDDLIFRAGLGLTFCGMLYYFYMLWRRRLSWTVTPEGAAADAQQFYMRELERLRDVHRNLWKVHVLGAGPGGLLLCVWFFAQRPDHAMLFVGGIVVAALAYLWYEARMARRYQRELDALDSVEEPVQA